MGGMGKTTLARKLYTHQFMAEYFDCLAWITISQQFDAPHTLRSLLHCFGIPTHEMLKKKDADLGTYVHQTLFSRRYLIVLDDIWETGAWDKLRMFFPDQRNGSRIILTTRQWKVANYVRKGDYAHKMCLLDEHNSWRLLVDNVFGKETCPPELVETGRRIANNCGGLPLAIIVMAGYLCKSERTLELWDSVERDFKSASTKFDPQSLEVLSMSYNYLPYHLKPCFLYVAAFPQFDEIQASRIIKLWIAEGIIKPVDDRPLEEVAHEYFNELIDRSLLSVCQLESKGKVRTFKIHHLLRELCQIKALEEKFLWMIYSDDLDFLEGEGIMRRVSAVHSLYQAETVHLSRVRSYLCFSDRQGNIPLCTNLRLLRVLDVFQLELVKFPIEIKQLINLRYLGLSCRSPIHPSIFQFLNLQTLIIRLPLFEYICLPSLMWKMTQLMHINFKDSCIRYRPRNVQMDIHMNLETLSNVEASGIRELLRRVPNLRKLGIHYDTPINSVIDLACLEKLEKLKCSSIWPSTTEFLSFLNLPDSLKKLTVSHCEIPVEFITKIGLLPHLEELRLQQSDFWCEEGELTEAESETTKPRWEPAEGGFLELISLVMEDLNLVHWVVDDTTFPVLQRLVIRGCSCMEEISLDIGSTPTLVLIKVDAASTSLLDSVREMEKQQQQEFENDSLTFDLPQAI